MKDNALFLQFTYAEQRLYYLFEDMFCFFDFAVGSIVLYGLIESVLKTQLA